ncbi:host attachment protein [Brunnivagina elsteri]|uniref:Host attachment protein n=1 Tax=Brunnivagina elsteri CCALA 953 TaxID=987040 RepID=A0A2A2TJU0_9CYAN|nr:host attachment protein [Calothrix elsteri]PAX56139.1 host attachment protein [Calothrix elsteri CCALA 953]
MNTCLVAIIDGARARFLTLEPIENLLDESNCHLIEHKRLLNSAKELQGKELWTTTKTGRNQGAASQAHAYDDGRENHLNEYGRRFARAIADEIIEFTQRQSIRQLVLVAEAQTLGILRGSVIPLLPNTLNVQVITKDLCKLKASEIHEYLAAKNLLPAHKAIS